MSRTAAKNNDTNSDIVSQKTKSIVSKKEAIKRGNVSLIFEFNPSDLDEDELVIEGSQLLENKVESTATVESEAEAESERGLFEVDSFELDESFFEMEMKLDEDKTMKTVIFNAADLAALKDDEPEAESEEDIVEDLAEASDAESDEASELPVDELIGFTAKESIKTDAADPTECNLLVGSFQGDDATCEYKLEEVEANSAASPVQDIEEFSLKDAGTASRTDIVNILDILVEDDDETLNEMDFNINSNELEFKVNNDQTEFSAHNNEMNYKIDNNFPSDKKLEENDLVIEDEKSVSPSLDEFKYQSKAEVETVASEMDVHATIRALREDRETVLEERASLKESLREYEQDILSLRANLEESRIEVAILRKRYNSEIEDYNYRLVLAEDKMHRAQEMAKLEREKGQRLEQKIRIDYSQVRHREKELESKLELLTMDVDAQINSRDQKILELRRKIDSLEFNMENASDRELKSNEDKKRLEDRLSKMMKTLKHSIKHLEDEVDEVVAENQSHKDKN